MSPTTTLQGILKSAAPAERGALRTILSALPPTAFVESNPTRDTLETMIARALECERVGGGYRRTLTGADVATVSFDTVYRAFVLACQLDPDVRAAALTEHPAAAQSAAA